MAKMVRLDAQTGMARMLRTSSEPNSQKTSGFSLFAAALTHEENIIVIERIGFHLQADPV